MRVRKLWVAPLALAAAMAVGAAVPLEPFTFQSSYAGSPSANPAQSALKKRITKRFVNTQLSEVLAWLSLEQLSFVAEIGAFPDKKVTLNFVNQPLEKVLDAIASAFGGTWNKKGDIWTLKPDSGWASRSLAVTSLATRPEVGGTLQIAPTISRLTTPSGQTVAVTPALSLGTVVTQGETTLTEEQRAEIRKALVAAQDELKKAIEELKKAQGRPGASEREQLESMRKLIDEVLRGALPKVLGEIGEGKVVPPGAKDKLFVERVKVEALKDVEKAAKGREEALKELDVKAKLLDQEMIEKLKKAHGVDPEQMKKLHEEILKSTKSHLKMLDKDMFEKLKSLQGKDFDVKVFTSDEALKLWKEQSQLGKKLETPPLMKKYFDETSKGMFVLGSASIDGLLNSLTAEQRSKMEKQGYLTPGDLTAKQKALLGKMPDGRWEITYVKNGQKLTIRNNS